MAMMPKRMASMMAQNIENDPPPLFLLVSRALSDGEETEEASAAAAAAACFCSGHFPKNKSKRGQLINAMNDDNPFLIRIHTYIHTHIHMYTPHPDTQAT
jgi:hypothetical protein